MKTKLKRGRPTKYSAQTSKRVMYYTLDCIKKQIFPTIEGLASFFRVGTRTLYDWQIKYDDFSLAIDILKDKQKELLITNGLINKYNTRFSMFLLRANHDMFEKEPLANTTQNNNLNISPELLVKALEAAES